MVVQQMKCAGREPPLPPPCPLELKYVLYLFSENNAPNLLTRYSIGDQTSGMRRWRVVGFDDDTRDYFENLEVDGKITLKWNVRTPNHYTN